MKKIDMCLIKSQCTDGIKKAENTIGSVIEKSKDIIISPKFSSDFKIKSRKNDKEIFGLKMKCDKEISLFKLVLGVIAVIATITLVYAALEAIFSNKSDNCDCE